MKKRNKKIVCGIFLFLFCFSLMAHPYQAAAQTINEFKSEVEKYTKELEEKQNKIAKNDAEVAEITQRISEIQSQMKQAQDDIITLQNEIDESNQEIAEKGKESKKIVEYYQVANGENAYLEYAFGANDITDMIYRMSVVEQLMEYNDKIMKELEALIERNKAKQQELEQKKKELDALQQELKSEREKINAETQAVRDTMPSIKEQIKAAKENIAYLEKMGCGANEDVQSCIYRVNQATGASVPSSGATLRPITNGRRQGGVGSYSGHLGQDMTSPNKKAETIYPIANGYVISVYRDNCYSFCDYTCNGNANIIVIRHNINNRYIYASYMHLSRVNVSEGQIVSAYTPLGQMGNTGCTSGSDEGGTSIHLHLELATCHWKPGGGCTSYWSYTNKILNPANYVAFPSSWNNR